MSIISSHMSLASSSSAPEPPYPADTKAKGWRFELDYERIEQSDTWVLATPDMRPWLLMIWLTAWRQIPCGSLPATDDLIAARIGMDLRQFRANRDVLLRGWRLASDGRLYHPVITEQVVGLIALRTKESSRKQAYRNKKNQSLGDECPAGHGRDSQGIPVGATTPEPEPEPEPEKTALSPAHARVTPTALSIVLMRAGIRSHGSHPSVIAMAEAGVTVETLKAAIDEAKAATGGDCGVKYVGAIALRWQRERHSAADGADRVPARGRAPPMSRSESYLAALSNLSRPKPQQEVLDVEPGPPRLDR